jgi:hypothetical protein
MRITSCRGPAQGEFRGMRREEAKELGEDWPTEAGSQGAASGIR